MRSAKTDQIAWTRRLIWVFAGRTSLIVGFVMRWFIGNIELQQNNGRDFRREKKLVQAQHPRPLPKHPWPVVVSTYRSKAVPLLHCLSPQLWVVRRSIRSGSSCQQDVLIIIFIWARALFVCPLLQLCCCVLLLFIHHFFFQCLEKAVSRYYRLSWGIHLFY